MPDYNQDPTFVGLSNKITTATSASVSTSTASASCLVANNSALYRCIQNVDSSITITLGLGIVPVAGTGIVLLPGWQYEMSYPLGNMFLGQVNAIAASGTPKLSVTEGV